MITLNPVLSFHFEPFFSLLGLPNQHPNPHKDIITMVIQLFFSSKVTNSIVKPPGESKDGLVQCRNIHKKRQLTQEKERERQKIK